MHPISPKKLLLSKWTAVQPMAKDKHFLVVTLVEPDAPEAGIEWIDIEAVMSKKVQRIAWRTLQNDAVWKRGWV